MELFSSLVYEALLNLIEGISSFNDAFSQQENYKVEEELQNTPNDLSDDDVSQPQDNCDVAISKSILVLNDESDA